MIQLEKSTQTPEQLKEILYSQMSAESPHAYYKENVDSAKLYRAITSGRGLDDYMHQFKPREDEALFEQRKRITCHIVPSVCKNVRDVEYKVPRSNSITKVFNVEEGNEDRAKKLHEVLDKFWGRYSFDNYMALRWIELNDTDPNTFVVVEWKPFEKTDRAQPYPFEVTSEMSWNYAYENNILLWLLVKNGDYTIYGANCTIKLSEVDVKELYKELPNYIKEDGQEVEYQQMRFIRFKKKYYLVTEPTPHNLGVVPAIQVGYMRDPSTNGLTYLPPWWAALPTLRNLITAKSELDLTEALHVFPQKIRYAPRCQKEGCNAGKTPDGGICSGCKGTGYSGHTSSQDEITLALPKDKEQMIDLVNLVHYVYPPTELIKYMDDYVDKLSARCMKQVYNSEIYSRDAIAETATGKNIDLQAVYDTLYPMVEEMSIDWEFLIAVIQEVTELTGIKASFFFSKDFKLKSLDNYYFDLQTVSQSGASSFIKASIEDDIARMLYADDKFQHARYLTKRRFDPFSGDSEAIIQLKLRDTKVADESKILYLNYELIFDNLELENPNIYFLNFDKQTQAVNAQIDKLKERLGEQQAATRTQFFGE